MKDILASARMTLASILICVAAYSLVLLAFAHIVTPGAADGSLVFNAEGNPVGSALIAQKFESPRYFRPRLSAVDYNASAAGGSNLSPADPKIAERALPVLEYFGTTPGNPVPADLVTASGSGLDPHITEEAALYQVSRVASARGIPENAVADLVRNMAEPPGGIFADTGKIVNVLLLNIALEGTTIR